MKDGKNILLIILTILVLVVLGALKKIESKLDSIGQEVTEQGKKITTLYDHVDAELHSEEKVQEE